MLTVYPLLPFRSAALNHRLPPLLGAAYKRTLACNQPHGHSHLGLTHFPGFLPSIFPSLSLLSGAGMADNLIGYRYY